MKIFEVGILVFLKEENALFKVIWLKINISSVFFILTETLLETNREMRGKKKTLFSMGHIWGFS